MEELHLGEFYRSSKWCLIVLLYVPLSILFFIFDMSSPPHILTENLENISSFKFLFEYHFFFEVFYNNSRKWKDK